MFLSLAHNHIVESTPDNGIEIQIEKNTNECVICASHFKVSVSSNSGLSPVTLNWQVLHLQTLSVHISAKIGLYNNRAPPVVQLA